METRIACKVPLNLLQMEGICVTITITVPVSKKLSSVALFKNVFAYQYIPKSNIHHLSFECRDGKLQGSLEYKVHGLQR